MAGRLEIKAIGPSYQLADRKSAVQRSVNCYLRQIEGLGEDRQLVLDSAPGLALLVDFGAVIRGSVNADGRWFVVAGSGLYEVQSSGAYQIRGSLITNTGFVSLSYSESQLVAVDGPNGYVLNLFGNTFAQIASAGWRGSDWVEYLDGYSIFAEPGTDQFYISGIEDAASLDPLDFSSADAQPDKILAFRVLKREIYFFGRKSTEVWINSGGADFPFARFNSTPIDVGCVGKRAAVLAGDTLVFVGRTVNGSGFVYRMDGHQPVRISTQAVEEALKTSTDISQTAMWAYQTEGSEFAAINAPGMQTTWVYEFSTQQWAERAELAPPGSVNQWQPFRADLMTFYDQKHFCASGTKLYLLDKNAETFDGAEIVVERTWPHLMLPSAEPVSYRGLEVQCTTGSEAAGVMTLEVSNDGGYVYGPPLLRSLGATGRRMQRVRWGFLGSAINRVFRLRTSSAVPMVIHSAEVDA